MTAAELIERYLNFFQKRGHQLLPNLPLVPENDPSTLFVTAGMQPLVPYLLGQPHPLGKRLVSNQRCLRTVDIDEVGDNRHLTFFEMLGNWGLGDYFKEESLSWSFQFLTEELHLKPDRLYATVFSGDDKVPQDEESIGIWRAIFKKQGLSFGIGERIFAYDRKKNWWETGAVGGPGGPDSEIFYDTGRAHDSRFGENCHPNCDCGRFLEIWNNVFMEYQKKLKSQNSNLKADETEYEYELLPQKNVDTGFGTERVSAILQFIKGQIAEPDPFLTELFSSVIQIIEQISGKNYSDEKKSMRIIADHLRACAFAVADGVEPSNLEQGYVIRRLIRRAIRFGRLLGIKGLFTVKIAGAVIEDYQKRYPHLEEKKGKIEQVLTLEEEKFGKTLERGLKEFEKIVAALETKRPGLVSGQQAFNLYETFGFPIEMTVELAKEKGSSVAVDEFEREFKKHQAVSRASLAGKFAGGLADALPETRKLHTATHLLHQALRDVLGSSVSQKGSNITAERLRFDFSYPNRLTAEQTETIERLVNRKISEDLPVTVKMMSLRDAQAKGALSFFGERYPREVKIYSIGDYSQEVCAGPHVERTGVLGHFRIVKEEGVSSGARRIRAVLTKSKIQNFTFSF